MELNFNSTLEEYYKRFVDLQDKLKKSEEQRFVLEKKFNDMVLVAKEEEQTHYKKLRSQYKQFLDEDRKRQDRNEQIIRNLERIETRISMLTAKTERIDVLRRQYQYYLQRVTSQQRSREMIPPITRSKSFIYERYRHDYSHPEKSTQTIDFQTPIFDHPSMKKSFDSSNEEKLKILDKYLQNISSQRCKDLLNQEKEARETISFERPRWDKSLNEDIPSGASNQATVIADDIMNSIYSRYYNKGDLLLENNKKPDEFQFPEKKIKIKQELNDIPAESYGKIENDIRANEKTERNSFKLVENSRGLFDGNSILNAVHSELNDPRTELSSELQNPKMINTEKPKEISYDNAIYSKAIPEISIDKKQDNHIEQNLAQQIQSQPKSDYEKQLIENENIEISHINHKFETNDSTDNNSRLIYVDPNIDQSHYDQPKYPNDYSGSIQTVNSTETAKSSKLERNVDDGKEENFDQLQIDLHNQQPEQIQDNQDLQLVQSNTYDSQPIHSEVNEQSIDQDGQPGPEQYEQEGQSVHYNPSEQKTYCDENGQPIQFDQNEEPIQYDQNKDESQHNNNVHPTNNDSNMEIAQYDPNTQIHYDENGQSVQIDEHVQPIRYDYGAQPVQYDQSGQQIRYDENGQIVQPIQYQETGQPIDQDEQMAQYDENGQLIQYDQNGQPIQYDENGQPIQYDENGQLINQYNPYEQQVFYDQNGQIVQPQYDENGQMIPQYDENGQVVVLYDQNGQQYFGDQYDQSQQQYYDYGSQGQSQFDAGQYEQYQMNDQIQPDGTEAISAIEQPNNDNIEQESEDIKAVDAKAPSQRDAGQYEQYQINDEIQPDGTEGISVNEQQNNDTIEEEREDVKSTDAAKASNVMEMLDTDTESTKQNISKVSNESDFDFN